MCRGVLAAAAATGILSLSYSAAFADSNAAGSAKDSPGVLSGNAVQAPVDAPVNVCGNTVNGVAALDATFGNKCENDDSPEPPKADVPDAPKASATPKPSDDCSETPTPTPTPTPPTRVVEKPRPTPPAPPTRTSHTPPPKRSVAEPPQLAETGTRTMLATSAASAALIAGGVMMYRRGRTAAQR
ncbi:chaplin [Streptomyces sp. NPDC001480]|uniref:chaplin n=1 Tax=Streptomyces sp. NPDC001480 TaxID=3364577 RepID=UPI0036B4ECDD